MTERVATTPGLYPLPDWAKETLSDLKGHQKGDLLSGDEGGEIEATYEEVRGEYVDDQLEAGLDRVVEGQARWDDMIAHPLTIHDNVFEILTNEEPNSSVAPTDECHDWWFV